MEIRMGWFPVHATDEEVPLAVVADVQLCWLEENLNVGWCNHPNCVKYRVRTHRFNEGGCWNCFSEILSMLAITFWHAIMGEIIKPHAMKWWMPWYFGRSEPGGGVGKYFCCHWGSATTALSLCWTAGCRWESSADNEFVVHVCFCGWILAGRPLLGWKSIGEDFPRLRPPGWWRWFVRWSTLNAINIF